MIELVNMASEKLPKLGKYFFVLEQGITKKSLTQVEDIGLLIQEVK